MCRAEFKSFIPVVDKKMQETIKKELGKMYEEAKAELVASGDYNASKLVRFTYGNTHKMVPKNKDKPNGAKTN